MLQQLKFVKGAVATKDFVPALNHFHIADGYVTGYNGKIALCTPIPLDITATPRADAFIKAITTCEEEVVLSMTKAGRLAIHSGNFKANIECTTEPFPKVDRIGEFVENNGNLLDAFRKLLPFTGEDASRPWAQGVLLRGQSAFATNNIILAEFWLGYQFPYEVNIPKFTVNEILRIDEEPRGMQISESSITFYYDGGRWLHSTLFSTQWPDLAKVLSLPSNATPVPRGFFDAVRNLKPFTTDKLGKLHMWAEGMATVPQEAAMAGEGASVALALPSVAPDSVYSAEQLLLLEPVATRLDLTRYPQPSAWFGDGVRGAIIGMRL